jgi:biopolymer transport protein ExbD
MLRKTAISSFALSGLRTRYFPRFRVGQGLLSVAPWLNLVLLILFFLLLDSKFVLQPGVVVRLPEAPFRGGLHPTLTAVVLSVESGATGARDEIVFFDDERFLARNDQQMERLRSAFVGKAVRSPEATLVLQADVSVRHGTVMRILTMARETGIKEVDLATREEWARAPAIGTREAGSAR